MANENNNNGFLGTIGQALKSGFGASVGGLPGALAGNVIGSLFSSSQAKKQHDLNMRDWYAMQDYNSPKNQVSRLKDAGLNPARALAGGQIENVTGMPNPTDVNAGLPAGITSFQTNQEMSMKYRANEAQVKNIEANTKLAESQAAKTDKETSWIDDLNSSTLKLVGSQVGVNNKNVEKLGSDIQVNDSIVALNDVVKSMDESLARKYSQEADNAVKEFEILGQQLENLKQEKENLVKLGKKIDSETNFNYVNAKVIRDVADANIPNIETNTEYISSLTKQAQEMTKKIVEEKDAVKQQRLIQGYLFPAEFMKAVADAKKAGSEAEMAKLQAELYARYAEVKEWLTIANQSLDALDKAYQYTPLGKMEKLGDKAWQLIK